MQSLLERFKWRSDYSCPYHTNPGLLMSHCGIYNWQNPCLYHFSDIDSGGLGNASLLIQKAPNLVRDFASDGLDLIVEVVPNLLARFVEDRIIRRIALRSSKKCASRPATP